MQNVQEELNLDYQVPETQTPVEDAILARWSADAPETEPSQDESEEATAEELPTEEEDEPELEELEELDEASEDVDEADDVDDETEDEQDTDSNVDITDETEVEFVVAGETHTSTIGQLKRLAGQEASLTRKSQELAKQRKDAEDVSNRSHVVLQRLLADAKERAKPYEEVDMLVASRTMDTEDFAQLRKEAQAAQSHLKFIEEEADTFYKDLQQQQQAAMQNAAGEAVKVLQEAIPDWSNSLYNDIRSYAVAQGLPQEQVDTIVDPVVIQLLNKSRLYDQGKRVATVKKKTAAKKKVLRSKKAPANAQTRAAAKRDKALDTLRNSRDSEDIADAILKRWEQ